MQTKILPILFTGLIIGAIGGYFFAIKKSADPQIRTSNNPHIRTSSNPQTYTCAMHPQIRQNEPGICPICEMDLIPLEKNGSDDPLVLEMTPEAVKLANIQTTIVGHKANHSGKEIRLSGKVQADERLASSQVAHVPGRIEKLFITFTGEQVTKGQKLAVIYSPEMIAAQRELLEALKLSALNPGLIEAARNKLRFWKINDETIEMIEQSGKIQETFIIFADATGIVSKRRVALGDYLKKGEPLFDLISLEKVWVLFDAYEEDLADIKKGNRIVFTTPALPKRTFQANITFIDPFINPKTRVASLRVEVNNPNGLLKPEFFVTGILTKKGDSSDHLTVPKSAVLWTGKRSVVYVKLADATIPSYQYREVVIGETIGENYQIFSGLEAGEEVVTYGSFSIDAAAQLNNQQSMMNKVVRIKGVDNQLFTDFKGKTPIDFKTQLDDLVLKYIQLKDAFVNSDEKNVVLASEGFVEELKKVDMNLVKGAAHHFWMEQLNALKFHSNKIIETPKLEAQRRQFDFLSNVLIKTVQAFGTNSKKFYVQHCPMAVKEDGADWIALEQEIRNPYFGEKMLKCGSVKGLLPIETEKSQQETTNSKSFHNH